MFGLKTLQYLQYMHDARNVLKHVVALGCSAAGSSFNVDFACTCNSRHAVILPNNRRKPLKVHSSNGTRMCCSYGPSLWRCVNFLSF